jgi:hypothetical protein
MLKELGFNTIFTAFVKGLGVVAILAMATILNPLEYSKFGIYYAIITGMAVVVQSGAVEIAAANLPKHKEYRESFVKALISRYENIVIRLVGILLLTLIISELFGNMIFYNIVPILTCLIIGLIIALGIVKSNLYRLVSFHNQASIALISGTVMSSGFMLLAAFFYKSADTSIFCSGIFLVLTLLITKRTRVLKVPLDKEFLASINASSSSKHIYFNYLMISVLGWIGGYGINLVTATLLDSSLVGPYTLIYSLISGVTMVAAIFNNIWLAKFIELSFDSTLSAQNQNKKVFMFELMSIFFIGIVFLVIINMPFNYFGIDIMQVVAKKPLLIALTLSSILISVPTWEMQNYYIREAMAERYRVVAVRASLIGFIVWTILMMVFGETGLYWGVFLNALIKTIFLERDFFLSWQRTELFKWALFFCLSLIAISIFFDVNN